MDPIKDLLATAKNKTLQSRPFVSLSYAQSLDGALTLQQGKHTAISSDEAWKLTHELRAAHDGLIIGIGSVLADDPRLTVRLASGENPRPIILDSRLRTPLDARMLANDKKPWIFTCQTAPEKKREALEAQGARIFDVQQTPEQQIDLCEVLGVLYDQGIKNVMVEGGGQIISSFLKNQLPDYLVVTVSLRMLGGYPAIQDKLGSFENDTKFPLSPKLINAKTARYEEDVVIWGAFDYPEKQPC